MKSVKRIETKPIIRPKEAFVEFKFIMKAKKVEAQSLPFVFFDRCAKDQVFLPQNGSVSTGNMPDIANLLDKLVHSSKKLSGKFLVEGGVFDQAQFYFVIVNNRMHLNIYRASKEAHSLLRKHASLLRSRLLPHEIKLVDFRFFS
jgi:hypothetical protein